MATDETRARIIEAAGPIFAEKGFRDATIREICDTAGVGLASVNYHFRDKQHLYVHVVEAAFDEMVRLRPPLKDWPPGTPPEERLLEWIERLANQVLATLKDSWQDRLLGREIQEPTPACKKVLHRQIDRELLPLDAILADALPPDAGPTERRRFAISIIGQILIYDSHREFVRMLFDVKERESIDLSAPTIARHVQRVSLAALGLAPTMGRIRTGSPNAPDENFGRTTASQSTPHSKPSSGERV